MFDLGGTQLFSLTLGVLEEAEFYNITSLIKLAKDKSESETAKHHR